MRQHSISPNVNTLTKWHFYMRRMLIRLLRPTYRNLRRSLQKFLQKRTNVLHFLVLAAAIAATLILQRKVQKTKNCTQIRCNRMHSLNNSKTVMRWLKEVWLTRTTKIIHFVKASFQCLRSFRKGKKDGPKLR